MAKTTRGRAHTPETQVNELIDQWGEDLDDSEFIEALELMIDHATTARDARQEEMGDPD